MFTIYLALGEFYGVEDVFRTHVSFNRKDNMEKKTFGEGACNFIKSLKRQENFLTFPIWYKVELFSISYVLGQGIWRENANSIFCLMII